MQCDLLIKNGLIIDGSGKPGFYGDIAINKGKILELSSSSDFEAERIIDATGFIVSPGFIDPHVHAELVVLANSQFEEFPRQGVTTIINGNCGHSVTPCFSENIYEYMALKGLMSFKDKEKYLQNVQAWVDFSSYIEVVKSSGTNINMGFLLGHGTLRWSVMGDTKDRKPSKDEETKIHRFIAEGMEQGALGISTGLAYTPSKYADTAELIQLSKLVKKYDGIYTSHIRTYLGLREAVQETITIAEAADIRVQVSHLTPTCPEAFYDISAARKRGVEIAVDTIPKSSGHFKRKDKFLQFIATASSKPLKLGRNNLEESLKTHEGRRKLIKRIRFKEQLMIFNTEDPRLEKRTLIDISQEKDLKVDDLLAHLIAGDSPKLTFCQGGLTRWDFPGTSYEDAIAKNPLVMAGSDKIFGDSEDPSDWYELFRNGAFPIFMDLCRQSGLPLEEIIRRITSLPAQQFRLTDRGVLARGKAADITIIDLDYYAYPAQEEIDCYNPLNLAKGVKYTIVNGQVVFDHGEIKNSKAGQLISKYGRIL